MKNHKLKIISELLITGRGKIITISLKENGFNSLTFRDENTNISDTIELMDTFEHEDKKYSIIGIESAKQLFGYADIIGLLVKEIEVEK